jgi:hypothetical protein
MADTGPDLHVASLQYSVQPNEQITYVNCPPVDFDTEEARLLLADGKLKCEMKTHFSTAEAARAVVEPILRAWEVDADLRWGRGELRFKFDGADIIDRSPVPPGVTHGCAYAVLPAIMVSAAGTVSIHVDRGQYPEPPRSFRLNPDAESILLRYQVHLDGREPLPSMAYFCLTVLEAKVTEGRHRKLRAAAEYKIDKAVVRKIGELSTDHGDLLNARKATAMKPLTGQERGWLEAAVKMLIWRLGDTRKRSALPLITMSDLPTL